MSLNYDYNHQNGTHHDVFGIKANRISVFEQQGYWVKVVQELERENSTFNDILRNPLILTAPKTYVGALEYAFPSLTTFQACFPLGKILQVHVLYPETETQTKTFVLVYGKLKHPVLNPLNQAIAIECSRNCCRAGYTSHRNILSSPKIETAATK